MAPTLLIESLEAVRRRVRLLAVLFGVGLVVAAAATLLLTTAAADYLLNLPAVARLALVAAAVVAIGYVLWRWPVRSLMARLTLNDVAGRVERTYPQFQDRLRSTVDIVTGRDVPGSDVMKRRVVSEAVRLTQSLDLSRVVVARPVWYSSGAAAAAVAAVVLLCVASPGMAKLAATRLFTPFDKSAVWPKAVQIESVGALPDRVSVGQRIDVGVKLTVGDRPNRQAVIHYQYDGGIEEKEVMTRGDDGVYRATVDARGPAAGVGGVKVWVTAGDDRRDFGPVRIVQRLAIRGVEATVTPPPYVTPATPVRVNLGQSGTVVTVGSRVVLTATFNKPLDPAKPVTAEVIADAKAVAPTWGKPTGETVSAVFTAAATVRFHLHATDTDGLTNTATEEFEVVVRPDQNPSVMIENPRRNDDYTPQAVVRLQGVAEDDFGVQSVTLVIDRLGDKKHWEVPLVLSAAPTPGVKWSRVDAAGELLRFRANYDWELSSLKDAGLQSGDVLEYFLSATDNYALDGAVHAPAVSGKLRVTIISQDQFTQKAMDLLQTTAEQVAAVKQAQAGTQKQTANLAKETAGKPQLDAADAVAADRLAGQQGTLAAQAKAVATKMADLQARMADNRSTNADLKDTARDVGKLMDSAAEGPMKDAAADVANAKQEPTADDRRAAFNAANKAQVQAGETVQKALDRMGNIGSLSRTIDSVRAALEEQRNLTAATTEAGKGNVGKTPEQMSAADRAKMAEVARQQAALGDKTAKLVDQMGRDAEKVAKNDPAGSAAMKQAADTAGQQNVTGNQQKAAAAADQNQQSQAQNAQKQAEMGLQAMLNDLKEAEKHKLEELQKKLAEMQQQIAGLVRRQAGHNLDTVAAGGAATAAKMTGEQRAALIALAERDPAALPPVPELGLIDTAQEQTERNTRDLAKVAEDLPEGAEPADKLTDAADKMERAIVNLRAEKLAAAYDPSQVDALQALLSAKQMVDKQKQKSDQSEQNQKKEQIRQAYMKIRADQDAVDQVTATLDAAPRTDEGTRRRADTIELGKQTSRQGEVAKATDDLDPALKALGGVVYGWANRDIVKNMRQLKDALGRQETGPVVQSRQRQVVAQLDAMIRDLATEPDKSQFAQHDDGKGGGKGGGGKKGMPTEAELRLLKDLQVAENTATVDVSKLANVAPSDVVPVGDRQGDLRNLLDQLMQKASNGQSKLPPEPPPERKLPEELKPADAVKVAEKVDEKELEGELIGPGDVGPPAKPGDKPKEKSADHSMAVVGDRMARARQRLALNNDPGPVTQEIQKRILDNLDDLIQQARQKEAQSQNSPPKPGGDPGEKADGKPQGQKSADQQKADAEAKAKAAKEGGTAPAGTADSHGGGAKNPEGTPDVARQDERMWGGVSPRQRAAVAEGLGEKPLSKYQKMVDDYFRAMSNKVDGK